MPIKSLIMSPSTFWIFMIFFLGFMILAVFLIRYIHQRRQQERLQQEVSNLLYEYVPMDGYDLEAVNFNSDIDSKRTSLLDARHI